MTLDPTLTVIFYLVVIFGPLTVGAFIAERVDAAHERGERRQARAEARAQRQEEEDQSLVWEGLSWQD